MVYYDQYGEKYTGYYDDSREEGEKWVTRDVPEIEFTVNDDDTVTLTCVSAELRNVQLTASCYGTKVTITLYLREAPTS